MTFLSKNPNLNLVADSRQVNQSSVFFAILGSASDGHTYLPLAIAQGAQALVVQKEHPLAKGLNALTAKVFQVESSRKAWAEAWRQKTASPDTKLFVLGITGTNGKTSMAHMAEHILNLAKKPCAVMGTIDHHLGDKIWPTTMTTPGADILFPRLNEFIEQGAKACAMEISSHGLHQNRAEGLAIDAAIFSNLTNDHLDYHLDLHDYFASKQLLFTRLLEPSTKSSKVAVINLMDDWGTKIQISSAYKTFYLYDSGAKSFNEKKIFDFLKEQKSKFPVVACDLRILESNQYGSHFTLDIDGVNLKLQLPCVGEFQVYNWVQVVISLWDLINDPEIFRQASLTFAGVPGRLQKVLAPGSDKNIFIDYAHTPDALERALQSLKRTTDSGSITVVFGCGGDRDQSKRPLMAKVSESGADHVIVTNDNPRTEDPEKIANQILAGFKKIKPEVILDRQSAIAAGINKLKTSEDILLIAGKGHEDYQILGTQKIHFSDYEQALKLIHKGEI